MNRAEKIIAWLLTAILALVDVIAISTFINARNLDNIIGVIYYSTTLVIIYPRTPLRTSTRMFCAFLTFLIGFSLGLI